MRQSRLFLDSLVEGDPAAVAQARRNRAVSLCLSAATQVLLLLAALVIPLVVTAERPRAMLLTPSPPYYVPVRSPQPAGPRAPSGHPPRHSIFKSGVPFFQPAKIPPTVADIHDEDAGVGLPPGVIAIPGNERGVIPGIPDAFGSGSQPPLPEPPAKKPSAPVRRSEGVQQALLVHRVTPEYPILARQARMEGKVVLRAVIGRDGTIRELSVVEGSPLFVREALAAVEQWRYQPTRLNGEPVEVETLITILFKLQR